MIRRRVRRGELKVKITANTEQEIQDFADFIEESYEVMWGGVPRLGDREEYHIFLDIAPLEEVN